MVQFMLLRRCCGQECCFEKRKMLSLKLVNDEKQVMKHIWEGILIKLRKMFKCFIK